MGDVHQNQLTPEGKQSTSSSAASYPKAYSSFSPVIPNTIKENEKKVPQEIERLGSTISQLQFETREHVARNKEFKLTTGAMHTTRGISFDPKTCINVLEDAKIRLIRAKESGDTKIMVKTFLEISQVVRMVTDYLYLYGVNMDISAHHWVLGLSITKTTCFAIASAAGGSLLGGTVIAGGIAGGAASLLDTLATEISKGIIGTSEGWQSAVLNILQGTGTAALFGLAGGLFGTAPGFSAVLGHSNVVINMASNTTLNLALDTGFLATLADLVTTLKGSGDIDFDYTIPFEIQSYLLHKRAAEIDPDIQVDPQTQKFVNNAKIHVPKPSGRVPGHLMGGIPSALSANNYMSGEYEGVRIVDQEAYDNKSDLASLVNKERANMPNLLEKSVDELISLGEDLQKQAGLIFTREDKIVYWKEHNSYVQYYEGEFHNRTITSKDNNRIMYESGNEYHLNSNMQFTYQGKLIVSQEDFIKSQESVTALNSTIIPALKKMNKDYRSMAAYLTVILDAIHAIKE